MRGPAIGRYAGSVPDIWPNVRGCALQLARFTGPLCDHLGHAEGTPARGARRMTARRAVTSGDVQSG